MSLTIKTFLFNWALLKESINHGASTSMWPAVKFSHLKNAALSRKLQSSASCALIIVVFVWRTVQMIFLISWPLFAFSRSTPIYGSGVFNQSILLPFQSQKHAAISIYSKDLSPPLFVLPLGSPPLTSPLVPSLPSFFSSPFFPLLLLFFLFLRTLKFTINLRCVSLPPDRTQHFRPAGATCLEIFLFTVSPSSQRPHPLAHVEACLFCPATYDTEYVARLFLIPPHTFLKSHLYSSSHFNLTFNLLILRPSPPSVCLLDLSSSSLPLSAP